MGGLSKNKLRQALSRIFRIANWKIAIILVLLGFLAATLLRFDHIHMTELREAVLAADEAEDDEQIKAALSELRSYTLKHIIFNTVEDNGQTKITYGTGPFYLEHQYVRKANEAIAAAQAEIDRNSSNPNGNIYQKVAAICDDLSRRNGWGFNSNYIQCFQDELAKYPVEETMDAYGKAVLPSTELFRYEFLSPIWCPCWSGIVILICAILALIFIVRVVIWICIRIALTLIDRKK